MPIVEAVIEVNKRQRQWAYQQIMRNIDSDNGSVVGVLGLAFKPDTDDIRNAPAIDVIQQILEQNIEVRAHDPVAIDNTRQLLPNLRYCQDPYELALDCDAILLATEWPQYLELEWGRIRSLMRGSVLLDGRNVLDGAVLSSLGFTYLSFGRHITDKALFHSVNTQTISTLIPELTRE
jgi:UDPglucose 6-dehydrogenase